LAKQQRLTSPIKLSQRGFSGRDIPEDKIIQSCVRCGLCLPHCPTYLETLKETSSPRGRIHLMEAVSEGRLSLTNPGFVGQMYQCLDCRACEAVCPSGVAYGKLVEAARTQIERAMPGSPLKRSIRWLVFRQLFGNMRVFRLLSRLLYLYQHSGLQWLARKSGILRLLRLQEMESLLPALPPSFLIPADQYYEPPAAISSSPIETTGETSPYHSSGGSGVVRSGDPRGRPQGSLAVPVPTSPTRVALFAGCIMSTAFAGTDRATIRVLLSHGCSVVVPARQGCCGALTIHAGDMDEARIMARHNIDAFERSGAEYIIVNAAGCGAALKEYAHLFYEDPECAGRAAHFSAQVRDITEFLADRPLIPPQQQLSLKVTYQEACHLVHAQRISQQPRKLLRSIPGITLVEMQESALCCGSAGIYNVTQPEMSRHLQERKIQHVQETGAEVVITANPGCFLQLQSGLRKVGSNMRVMHIVDVLDKAYRQE
jgi:glycolate dehydrogenase iron-sulfur subunit